MSLAFPKPARRCPKTRRRIKRRTSLRWPRRTEPEALKRGRLRTRHLRKLCDDTFALYVRVRDRNRCRLCGADGQRGAATQAAHLISRSYYQCRLLPENCWCLCSSCHRRYSGPAASLQWDELVEKAVGVVEWARRKALAQVPTRIDWSAARLPLLLLLREGVRENTACGLDVQLERIELRHAVYERRIRGSIQQAG